MKNMKDMSDRHKWAKYEMDDEDRPYYNPRFGGNLKEFIRRMVEEEGFTIGSLFPYYDGRSNCLIKGGIAIDDYETMAYQALNHEHSNMDFKKDDNSQTISIMMSGDAYCDVIPINDWSFRHGQEDVVSRVSKAMRQEIMGDEA
tara:strand:+ start:83 stop:514 length:432 start_codon:yes stop_codon:yes gene_type:complete